MTTYRHVEAEAKGIVFPGDVPGGCIHCLWDDAPEPCRNPNPDPASPCGFEGCWMTGLSCHCDDPSEGCPGGHPITADGGHPFVATRCVTCGHAIEVAP